MATIMVVDDMAIFRDPIAASLRLEGHQTITAANGKDALAKLAIQRPDLILLDLAMPVMDGPTFLQILRSNPATASIPVILLTAISEKKHILQSAKLGIQDYLLKSRFSLKELLERIKKYPIAVTTRPASPPLSANRTPTPASAPTARSRSQAERVPEVFPASPSPAARPLTVPQLLTRDQCMQRTQRALQAKTLSGIVAQVIAMAASPRSDTSQLAALIAKDPMLSARVLQAANSAAYASSRGVVTTLADAVRHIGCATIRNIAAAFGIFDAMPECSADGFNPVRCWQHSFGVATLCEQLVSNLDNEGAGTAYLVGLCHDLGEILFHSHFGPEYRQVLEMERESGRPREELERRMLGVTRGELAMVILKSIGLPSAIQRPIEAFHDGPAGSRSGECNRLARILRLADAMANGMLLAASVNAPLIPLTRAEYRLATGSDLAQAPEAQMLRADIFSITGLLARLHSREEAKLMVPLLPRIDTHVLLVRDPAFSPFDPIAMALETIASLTVLDQLPHDASALKGAQAMVVLARAASTAGFTAADIDKVVRMNGNQPLPVLWLVMRDDVPAGAASSQRHAETCPIPLQRLADFLHRAEAQQNSTSDIEECDAAAA